MKGLESAGRAAARQITAVRGEASGEMRVRANAHEYVYLML